MKLVIGSDHAGFALKVAMGDLLRSLGHEVLDVGAFKRKPLGLPGTSPKPSDAQQPMAERTRRIDLRQRCRRKCSSQQSRRRAPGMCHDTYSAHQGVEHDDINVLVLGSRVSASSWRKNS